MIPKSPSSLVVLHGETPGKAPSMAFGLADDLSLCVHPNRVPSGQEWLKYLSTLSQALDRLSGVLVYSLGGGPDGLQRQQAAQFFHRAPKVLPVAVLTQSPMTRGLVRVFSWSTPQRLAAFEPSAIGGALAFLGSKATAETAQRHLDRLAELLALPAGH